MAQPKAAPLESGLLARKGDATPASAVVSPAREEPIAVTVKLPPELYWRLKHYGMQTKPKRTNQELIVEALTQYLGAQGVTG